MRYVLMLALFLFPSFAVPASAQQPMEGDKSWTALEKTLWDADQQWLCAGPYQKPYKDCVEFRSKYWDDQFFEVYPNGVTATKIEMVASQSADALPVPDPIQGLSSCEGFTETSRSLLTARHSRSPTRTAHPRLSRILDGCGCSYSRMGSGDPRQARGCLLSRQRHFWRAWGNRTTAGKSAAVRTNSLKSNLRRSIRSGWTPRCTARWIT